MSFSIDLAARKLKTKFTAHMVSGKRKLLFFGGLDHTVLQ